MVVVVLSLFVFLLFLFLLFLLLSSSSSSLLFGNYSVFFLRDVLLFLKIYALNSSAVSCEVSVFHAPYFSHISCFILWSFSSLFII
jgi:hypothetical protein